jgi:alanyl-tRNA synthetase
MTVRRYYADSYTRTFPTNVVELATAGGKPAAILDETFFYPTSGGQPHDTGRLGSTRVQNVSIREDGAVLHLLDAPLEPGPAEATIDWPRRFDHMQQHTGQHILSQAFIQVAEAPTIGFHLGAETVSIDLGQPGIGDAKVADALALANEVVTGNQAVRAWFPSAEELATLTLRKTPEVEGALRVVAIGHFDLSACGGTHVAQTGEIGLIEILRTERLKRGVRVEFLAGRRAAADYARKHGILRDLSVALTCGPAELPESVARLQGALAEAQRELKVFRERELDQEAARLLSTAGTAGPFRVVRAAWSERPMDEVKSLALRVTAESGVVSLLGVAGPRAQILFARSENVSVELKPAFDRTLAALGGGKGGGGRLLQGAAGPADVTRLEGALTAAEASLPQGTA